MKKFILIFLFSLVLPAVSVASGPNKLAKSDRSLWPYEINDVAGFNKASEYEILSFMRSFYEIEKSLKTEEDIKKFVGRDKVNLLSIDEYKGKIKALMVKNLHHSINLQDEPPKTWDETAPNLDVFFDKLPKELKPWYDNSKDFYANYVYEQIRLAALFPGITSEILPLDEEEITGTKMEDMHFLLTFDDGPSPKGGNTDKIIEILNTYKKPAIFFVLGDNFVKRDDVGTLYQGFLVGSHGKEHSPHTKKDFFEGSLNFNEEKISSFFPDRTNCYFRPPYGQRSIDTVEFLKEKTCKIMLWNIDSQDWSNKMSAKDVEDRVLTLMLLWRSGIVLFHDIHVKTNEALPHIFDKINNAGIVFEEGNI